MEELGAACVLTGSDKRCDANTNGQRITYDLDDCDMFALLDARKKITKIPTHKRSVIIASQCVSVDSMWLSVCKCVLWVVMCDACFSRLILGRKIKMTTH